jgi:hypothetical protein
MAERVAVKLEGRRWMWVLVVAVFIAIPGALAQAGGVAAKLPEYDVVSIKVNHSGSDSISIDSNNDTWKATNVSVKSLIENAYDLRKI